MVTPTATVLTGKRPGILDFSSNTQLNQAFGPRSARELRRWNRWTRR